MIVKVGDSLGWLISILPAWHATVRGPKYLEAGRITRCRRTVFGEMEKASGGEVVDAAALGEFTDVPRIPFPLHGAFAVSSGESGPTQSTWSTAVCHHQAALIARGRYCSERPDWGPLPTMAAVSWPLTKAVDLVPFGRRNAVHRRRWHSLLGAGRSGRQ